MKNLYSIIAVTLLSTTINAQIFNATFSDVTGTGGNDGAFSGSVAAANLASYTTGGAWTLSNAFKGDTCVKLGTSSKLGSITTPSISLTGIGTLTFRAGAWDGNSEKTKLNITISGGTLSQSSVTLTKGNFTDYSLDINAATGAIKITLEGESASSARFFIDDIKVIEGNLGVINVNPKKVNIVKNTIVSNEIIFARSGKIALVNMNGQTLKSADVTENYRLNITDLPKATYIITSNINGETVSQKIIKN